MIQFTIISLNTTVIYLNVVSIDGYKFLSSIFAINKNGIICSEQTADDKYNDKLSRLVCDNKRYMQLQAALRNIPNGSKFIICTGCIEDSIEIYKLRNIVRNLNGLAKDDLPNTINDISKNYHFQLYDGSAKKRMTYIGEKEKTKRICRFCGRSVPKTTFNSKSHAISETLGNKNIICSEECDDCNSRFGKTIEESITNMYSYILSLYGIKGKNGCRKTIGRNFQLSNDSLNGTPGIEMQIDGLTIDENNIQESLKSIPQLDASTLKYIPQNIYKCLCKYVLSVIDSKYIPHFQTTIDWINESVCYRKLPNIKSCQLSTLSTAPILCVFIRKNNDYSFPFCFASLDIANIRHMFIVPFSNMDKYSFTTENKANQFWAKIKDWFPKLKMEDMKLSSSKKTYTPIKLNIRIEQNCQLGRDYFIFEHI